MHIVVPLTLCGGIQIFIPLSLASLWRHANFCQVPPLLPPLLPSALSLSHLSSWGGGGFLFYISLIRYNRLHFFTSTLVKCMYDALTNTSVV
jgi:hypothetical protein